MQDVRCAHDSICGFCVCVRERDRQCDKRDQNGADKGKERDRNRYTLSDGKTFI